MEHADIFKTSKGFYVQIKQEPTSELSTQSFHSPFIKVENDCKSNLLNKHHTSELNQIDGKKNTVEFLENSLPLHLSVNSCCKKEIQIAYSMEGNDDRGSYDELQQVFDGNTGTCKSEITLQPNCDGDILQRHMTNSTHPDLAVKEEVKTVEDITLLEQQNPIVFPVALEKVSVTSEEVNEQVKFEVDEITEQQQAMVFPVSLEKGPNMPASSDKTFTISIEKMSTKQFTCDHCGAVFDQLRDLSLHLKIHPINSLNLSTCEKCNLLFITKYHLDDHKCGTDSEFNKHQYTSNLSKTISDKKSQKQQNHQAYSSKQSTFILPNNKSVIPKVPVLPQPLATVMKDNRVVPVVMMGVIIAKQPQELLYHCMHCTQAFATMKELDKHLESHPRYRPYKCKYCESSFLYRNQYKSHLRRHLGIRPFPCEKCRSCFYTKTELVSHLKSHLPKEKSCHLAKYLCDQCGKKFKSKKCLDDHMTTHTKMRNYKCPICEAAFAQKSTMKSHMRVHRKEKSFTCTTCGFSTKWRNALEKHEELHQKGKETYKCRDCHAEFLYKVQLTKHMQSHKVSASLGTHG